MISCPMEPLRLVARILQEGSTDGLSRAQALLAGHILRDVARAVEDDSHGDLSAILNSMACVMGDGAISPSLAFLLERAALDALVQMDSLSAEVSPISAG